LRPLSEEDIEAIYQSCKDPLIPKFTTVPENYTMELAQGFVREKTPRLFAEYKAIHWAFTINKDVSPAALKVAGETFLGPFSIHGIEEHNHIGEIGYWLNKDVRGHGYGSIGCQIITNYAFEALGFRRLAGIVDYDNEASKKVLLGAGYKHEGLMKSRVTRSDGSQIDMDLFAATADSWVTI
jgi:RimJ/RimL family protein N-acetyltransferase